MLGSWDAVPLDGVALTVDDASVERDVTRTRLTLTAERGLVDLATGRFARPSVGVRWHSDAFDPAIEFCGFAFTQFALPVTAGRELDFGFDQTPELRSPRAVLPLLARSGGRVRLLAPLSSPHEQVIAVVDDALVWGWHGDLDRAPAGFATELGVYDGTSVEQVLDVWRIDLAPIADRRADDPLLTHLSYWTDNGAAYWYRTERDRTIAESVTDTIDSLREAGVGVRSVELDSWFYPHATLRPIHEVGYPVHVPPTGAMEWRPRPDAFPPADDPHDARDPIERLADRLDRPPLVLHARHIDPQSPHVADGRASGEEWWVDEHVAHPANPTWFRRWFDDARRWGATVIEQDWMVVIWFGVRAMRSEPGRAAAWQRALDEHATASDVNLLWCMATPADLVLAAHLDRVIAVRTCDDYRYADDPAALWTWFLAVNRLTNALGLTAFKDCFFTNPDVSPDADPIDGDPHAELEALLAALSGGPVGLGDRLGRTNAEIVARTCDDDGRLRRLDRAISLTDDGMFGGPLRGDGLAWATTTATAQDGVWTYVVAINTAADRVQVSDRLVLEGDRWTYEWRASTWTRTQVLDVELAPRDWALFVVAPFGLDESAAASIVAPNSRRYVVVESA